MSVAAYDVWIMRGAGSLIDLTQCFASGSYWRIRWRILSIGFLALSIAACGYPERPKVVSVSNLEPFRPTSPREIKSVEQALAAIITVCRDDLKLPPVQTFAAHLYKNSQSFASYGLDWRMFPIDVAHMAAFAYETKIHVDLQKVNDDWGWASFTWLLAHEFGHTIHHEVSRVVPMTDPWFNEGFAEWVAAKVFDALGWRDYRVSVDWASKDIARHLDMLSHLSEFRSHQAWNRTRTANYGEIRTYALGFVAVDQLMKRKQLTSAISLLSAATFNEALGGTYDEFDRDLRRHISAYQSNSNLFAIVNAPTWKIGDKWKHELRRPGQVTVTEREFVRRGFFVGIPAYVLESGTEESLYSMDSLSLLARRRDNKYTYRVSNNEQRISWPLRPQKEWQLSFTRQDVEIGTTRTVKQLVRATGIEDVTVKAGRFRAVKMETYGYNSGRLAAEYWYSPEVKWFVRSRISYRDFGLVDEELVSYRVQ